ncbi:MAG: GNAT family N-acetyltransferase [Hyphomicrobiales bacterium]|nr:GNAT family N-acetyltransferase [Hyphomicrobiales bacterium]MCP5374273.1 GNAT family N-acetyltransferase [Hyphomicrobiales bacterium]
MTATIAAEDPDQPAVRALLAASDAYAAALYPAESNHLVDVAALGAAGARFLVARRGGQAVGCGAILPAGDGSAEIKRMWVEPAARGGGLGRHLLDALEAAARAAGIAVLRLETGVSQPAAIGLYRAAGFVDIPPFGDYRPDPLSLFMEKRLG